MAGFIDTHVHFPQVQVIASWGAQLLDWLNNYTFPEETRFASEAHGQRMARAFFDHLDQFPMAANALARAHRIDEAGFVAAIIDAHFDALDLGHGAIGGEIWYHRQGH